MSDYGLKKIDRVPFFIATVPSASLTGNANNFGEGALNTINNFPRIFTSRIIPETVSSNKGINYTEKSIPGGHTGIMQYSNMSATEIGFSVTFADFNSTRGVVATQKFFEILRTPEESRLGSIASAYIPFMPNPKVLYMYGTGSLPMQYFVTKCDFDLEEFNSLSFPQVIKVSMTLRLDESGPLYELERKFKGAMNLFTPAFKEILSKKKKNVYITKNDLFGGF